MNFRIPALLRGERGRAVAFVAVWLCAVVLLSAVVGALVRTAPSLRGPLHAGLVIEGPGWSISYDGRAGNNTAFRLLREANETLGFELTWVEYGWPYSDVFVTSINGTWNDGSPAVNRWWQYCVNEGYATVGAASQELHEGDTVRWVYAPPGGDEICR